MTNSIRVRVLAVLAALAACGDADPDLSPCGASDGSRVFAVATDFASAGVASTIDVPCMAVAANRLAGVASTDPVVRSFDQLYVINRYGADNVTVIDPDTMTLVSQFSTGGGSNPQDLAVADGKLYVVGLALGQVQVYDQAAPGDGVVATFDLSALDPDGVPDCVSIAAAGDRLAVACARYDAEFVPRGNGVVALLDRATGELVDTLELDYPNPVGFLRPAAALGGDLVLATAPDYADATKGCLERIAIVGEPSVSCWVDHADLGGQATGVAPTDDGAWLAVIAGFDAGGALGALRQVDASGTPGPVRSTPDQRIIDVTACPAGPLAVADASGGARIFDATGVEMTDALLDLGLPPVQGGLACW